MTSHIWAEDGSFETTISKKGEEVNQIQETTQVNVPEASPAEKKKLFDFTKYNIVGSFNYSLTNVQMNGNLKEAGEDYAGLNQRLNYLLMGTASWDFDFFRKTGAKGESSIWDVSNIGDFSYNPYQNRLIANVFRLEIRKEDTLINVGDFYPVYSSLTMDGLTIRGFGVKKVYNNRLTVQAVAVQSQEAKEPVKEDINGNSQIDPGEDGNGNNVLDVKQGDYRQLMWGARVENIFTPYFYAGSNFLLIHDDVSSIKNPQTVDSTSVLYPVSKNSVIGVDGHLHFLKDTVKIDSEYGASVYLLGDSAGVKYNDHASNVKLSLINKKLISKILYQKVGPNYYSEGNPYLETDKKGYDFENEFILSKKVSLVGNYEIYTDNLNDIQTDTTIGTKEMELRLKYYPEIGNWEIKYKNKTKDNKTGGDKHTKENTYAVTLRCDYGEDTWITYNFQYSGYEDIVSNSNNYTGYSGYVSWNYEVLKDRFTLIPYFNYNLYKYRNLEQKQVYYLTNVQSQLKLFKNKLFLIPYIGYDYSSQDSEKTLERFERKLETRYYFSSNISLSLEYDMLTNNDADNKLDYYVQKIGGGVTAIF